MKSIITLLIALGTCYALHAENCRSLLDGSPHFATTSCDSIAPQATACDTMFTTDGKTYLVQIVDPEQGAMVEFYMCGDEKSGALLLSKDKISRIGISPKKQKEWSKNKRGFYPLERMANQAMVFSIVAFVASVLVGLFALPFAIVGIIKGQKALRRIAQNPDHPAATAIKRKARAGVIVGFTYIILTVLFVLLFLLILI